MRSALILLSMLCATADARKFQLARQQPLLALRGGANPRPPLISLRGGGDAEPAHKTSIIVRQYAICAAVVLCWISVATLVFSLNEGWPIAQSLFYAVDTGMSIGFGAVAENKASTKLFTILHVLLGASAVGGAIALFAEAMVAESSRVAACEYSRMALLGAFEAADADRSGSLSRAELLAVLDGVGLKLDAAEADALLLSFDPSGDGLVSTEEFLAALSPHIRPGAGAADALRVAVTRRSEGPLKTRLREIGVVLSDNRTLVLWALWIALGAAWAYIVEGWDAVTSLYFAVGGLATGGLQAPSLGADGTLPRSSAVFVALYCLSGIPIFAMALGQFASVFVQRILAARERAALKRTISPEEYAFAERIFSADGHLDWSEFMALEMLRLGKVEMGTLEAIKREFDRLDADGNGSLSLSEVQAAREGAASPSALVQE